MKRFALFLIFFTPISFAQLNSNNAYFIAKGQDLYYWDTATLQKVISGATQLCFPLLLKGTDLYNIEVKPVLALTLVSRGVTKVFNNNYLIRDKLYTMVDGIGVYVTDGVTEVYNQCPDPSNRRAYSHLL